MSTHEEAMFIQNDATGRARWAVMCVTRKKGRSRVVRKDFGDDYVSARDLYLKARDKGLRAATLACVNMGFPPPVHLRPHTVRKKGRDRRTGKVRAVSIEVSPLRELNLEGKLWCPYCMEIRRFVLRKTSRLHGIAVADPKYACPICGVSNRDHNVRMWNPTATLHMESSLATKVRRPKKPTRRRRRRQ